MRGRVDCRAAGVHRPALRLYRQEPVAASVGRVIAR
jgi:hypothetical protein